MKVKGLAWLGTRTEDFEAMRAFYADTLGMTEGAEAPGFARFDLPDGAYVEVFGPEDPENAFMTAPVAGFLVEDIASARAEMEAKGVEFIGPVEHGRNGYAWTHFRAPDGFVYELTQNPAHPMNRAIPKTPP